MGFKDLFGYKKIIKARHGWPCSATNLTQKKLDKLLRDNPVYSYTHGYKFDPAQFIDMGFNNLKIVNQNLECATFKDVTMKNVIFDHDKLAYTTFNNVIMIDCTITNSDLCGSYFINCRISNCRFVNVNTKHSNMKRVCFEAVELDETTFNGATVEDVSLTKGTKETKSFIEAHAKGKERKAKEVQRLLRFLDERESLKEGNPSCIQLDVKKSSKQIAIDEVKQLVNQLKSDEKEKFQEYINSLSKEGKLDSSSFNYYYSQGYQHALENVINSLKENKHL